MAKKMTTREGLGEQEQATHYNPKTRNDNINTSGKKKQDEKEKKNFHSFRWNLTYLNIHAKFFDEVETYISTTKSLLFVEG